MFGLRQLNDDVEVLDDFVVLEAPPEAPSELNRFLSVSEYFYSTLTSSSEIDPRACAECIDTLTHMMKEQIKEVEDEYNDYKYFLENLESTDKDLDKFEKQLKDLLLEEKNLELEFLEAIWEEKKISSEIEQQIKERTRLFEEEEKCRKEYIKYLHYYYTLEEELINSKSLLAYTKQKNEELKRSDVFEATFHIWHKHDFGTINGFRLGYLRSSPVDWNEINAAWGQTSLLLSAIAKKMKLHFDEIRLVPYGNHSYIEIYTKKKQNLPLFGSGSFKYRWDNRFDTAMVFFLDCLQQLTKSNGPTGDRPIASFPYPIKSGRLVDGSSGIEYSIRIQFNSEEYWTRSLKFLLTNLKWAMVSKPELDLNLSK